MRKNAKMSELDMQLKYAEKPECFPLVSVKMVKEGRMKYAQIRALTDSQVIYDQFKRVFEQQIQEKVVAAFVNMHLEVISAQIVGIGTIGTCTVDKASIFRTALLSGASGIILMHNHPSGSLVASKEDIECTKSMIKIGKLLGIPVLDHIIFADDWYHSIRSHGEAKF
ncbi:MAG: JAB domain-containing protein [Roseburia faecis]|nr:JAB domain-containing protein [Roseburia faecis]